MPYRQKLNAVRHDFIMASQSCSGTIDDMKDMDQRDLCLRVINGDESAVNTVVEHYADMVYSVCYRILRNPADAEDAAQSVFIRFNEKKHTFDQNVKLAGWLCRTAIFISQNRLQKKHTRSFHERKAVQMKTETLEEKDVCNTREMENPRISGLIDAAVGQLPDKYRHVILMHFVGGVRKSDVAKTLGLGRSTVSMRLSRGIKKIQNSLAKAGVSVSASAMVFQLQRDESGLASPEFKSTIKDAIRGMKSGGAESASSRLVRSAAPPRSPPCPSRIPS